MCVQVKVENAEVGAYEAIESIRHIIDYEAAEAADNAALTHQDHMYVQRMSTKCGQCRRVSDKTNRLDK